MTEYPSHDTVAQEVMSWLNDLKNGVMTEKMARGSHFYFNCDGKNHYVYEVDESRREVKRNGKKGRKKRAYVGAIATARRFCPAESARWESNHKCHDPSGDIHPVGEVAGYSVFVVGK